MVLDLTAKLGKLPIYILHEISELLFHLPGMKSMTRR